jgi:hypothetical protein
MTSSKLQPTHCLRIETLYKYCHSFVEKLLMRIEVFIIHQVHLLDNIKIKTVKTPCDKESLSNYTGPIVPLKLARYYMYLFMYPFSHTFH